MTSDRIKRNQRPIIKRVIVKGNLVLDTPTCLGSGDTDGLIDLMILRDSISNHALLTGASIAGALRNYLHEYQYGLDTVLFGGTRQDEDGDQSSLIIDDAISTKPIQSELRDGVKIDSITRTVDPEARTKYDLELLQAGTEFPLCFELLIDKKEEDKTKQELYEAELHKGLAIALSGLEPNNSSKSGEISLGMKKRRGFGRCHVKEWQVWNFNLENTDANDRILWLNFEHWRAGFIPIFNVYTSITEGLKKAGILVAENWEDQRDRFTIQATFKLASPLLIRSGQAETGRAPDVVHLKSNRPDESTEPVAVLSGTSLAGVLRHRAERIVNTLGKPTTIIDEIFGPDFSNDKTKEAKASRLIVHESIINHTTDLVQTRIAIDRFTGGAYHGALFQEKPIFGRGDENVKLEIELLNATQEKDYEIGLLLLLIKDLWTQDLPVGGTSSIGRGRLQGKEATLTLYRSQQKETWTIIQLYKDKLQISDPARLQTFVQALVDYSTKEVKNYV